LLPAVLLAASAGCASPGPRPSAAVDRELYQAASLARDAFTRGAYEEAATYYRQALSRARVLKDPIEIGNSGYNLGVCLHLLGEHKVARRVFRDAREAYLRADRDVTDVVLMEADAARRQGDLEAAEELLGQALDEAGSRLDPAQRGRLHAMRAELACEGGNLMRAEAELYRAREVAGRHVSAALEAAMARVAGRILSVQEMPMPAAREYDREAALQARRNDAQAEAEAVVRAAEAYEKAGVLTEAAARYLQAARNLLARAQEERAKTLAEKALACAEQFGDARLAQEARSFLAQVAKGTRR
jgi:hypothetical protein